MKSVISRDLKRRDRGDSVEVYNAVHDALVFRTGIPVVHESAASQNKPVLVPFLDGETNLLSDARETPRSLTSETHLIQSLLHQPALLDVQQVLRWQIDSQLGGGRISAAGNVQSATVGIASNLYARHIL